MVTCPTILAYTNRLAMITVFILWTPFFTVIADETFGAFTRSRIRIADSSILAQAV